MIYIIFTLVHNLLDFLQVNLFKTAKHWDSFFTYCTLTFNYTVLLAAKTVNSADPGLRKGAFIHYKQYIFCTEKIIGKAPARCTTDDSSSSNPESNGDESNLSTHSLHAGHSDGGEVIDLDEDTDLNGQDSHRLLNVFQAEVLCFKVSIGAATKNGIFSSAPDLGKSERARVIIR